ncbi:MAG: thiamine pyrophosphate-binding protein [Deferrisomatales bacterium]|nr:thiamine pyrophosphate-binding protein [Deferrisomatales bacterium]
MNRAAQGPERSPDPTQGGEPVWGSDAVAQLLRDFSLPYVCINPGASFRGLHDSLVNYLGNTAPQILLCLHEEHAVAIAHGYAKVTGEPLGVILHSNVGVMHAAMAVFDAWCDRVPVLIMGATGPVDAAQRRPWIDWIHTARDQGALLRPFTKWDDQPASVPAALEALLRARQIARTSPKGPVYVCFDTTWQEARLPEMPQLPDLARYEAPASNHPAPDLITRAAGWLSGAGNPVILMGRVSRDMKAWGQRVALAEALGARVLTDLKVGAAFPTDHPLHAAPPGMFLTPQGIEQLQATDVILSLDWVDLAGTLKQAFGSAPATTARVIQVSPDQSLHNGWSMECQALPPTDLYLACDPEPVVAALCQAVSSGGAVSRYGTVPSVTAPVVSLEDAETIHMKQLARTLGQALEGDPVCLIRLPLGWIGELWHFRHPLDFLGYDGGGGVGSGPGMAVGAALALRGTDRLPVAILGDGDYLMGSTALWSAAHEEVPLLIVVANNRSFFNDEIHQERVARDRGRPVENRWIGQRIDDPAPDLAMVARAQGLDGIGPVKSPAALSEALADAVRRVKGGRACVVDVWVTPEVNPARGADQVRSSG